MEEQDRGDSRMVVVMQRESETPGSRQPDSKTAGSPADSRQPVTTNTCQCTAAVQLGILVRRLVTDHSDKVGLPSAR